MSIDKSKILTVVTADQAKVGMKGWFASNVETLSRMVEEEQPTKELLGIDDHNAVHAFKTVFQNHALFYPAPEPTYAERQAEWVKQNDIKVGTKVRFTKGFEDSADGSDCCEHRDAKGKEGFVNKIFDTYISVVLGDNCWVCPFTALEVIKEPTYRPYNSNELNDLVGEVLTNKRSGRRKLVTGKPTSAEGVNLDGSYINAKDLLYSFYRNRDEPCGVKES